MKCSSIPTLVVVIVLSYQATTVADAIDFSSLDVNALNDPAGQNFNWQLDGESGHVNVRVRLGNHWPW